MEMKKRINKSFFLDVVNKYLISFFKIPSNFILFCFIFIFSLFCCNMLSDGLLKIRVFFLDSNNVIEENISSPRTFSIPIKTNNLNSLQLFFESSIDNPKIAISIEGLQDNDYTFTQEVSENKEKYIRIVFSPTLTNYNNRNLNITLLSDDATIQTSDSGEIINKQYGLPRKLSILLISFLVGCILLFYFIYIKIRNLPLSYRYLILGFILGILALFIRPPCSQYDDLIHFDTTYNMSNIILGIGDAKDTGVLLKRQCDLNLLPDYYPENYFIQSTAWHDNYKEYFSHIVKNFSFNPDKTIVPSMADKVINSQRAFIFSAIAISLGRLLGFNQFILYYFGAFVNLSICLVLVFLGIKKNTEFNRHIIPCIALFPVVTMLFASYSYDALLIASSFAIISYTIAIYQSKQKSIKDIIFLSILSLFIIPIKAIYFLIPAFIGLLYWFKDESKCKKRLLIILIAVFVIYIISYLISLFHLIPYLDNQSPNRFNSLIKNYSLSYCLAHPLMFIKLIINTLITENWAMSISQLFFIAANPIDFVLPFLEKWYLFLFLMLCLSIKVSKENNKSIIYSSFLIFVFISLLIYLVGLTWTAQNSNVLWGVQSRYFIPVLPLFFYMISIAGIEKPYFSENCCLKYTTTISLFYFIDMFIRIVF